MLEDHLGSAVTRQRLRTGPAADHVEGFADSLRDLGYKPISIEFRLRQLAGFTDWIRDAGYAADRLLEGLDACRAALARRRRRPFARGANGESIVAASMYIRYLREQGVLPWPTPEPGPVETWPVLGEFRSWMVRHRGVRESTLDMYQEVLVDLLQALGDEPQDYTALDLRSFVLARARPHGISRAQRTTTATRAFLRFLGATGRCPAGLEEAIPAFTSWRQPSLPRYLEPADMQRVVDACVAEDGKGLRDRAVVLLLSRLGLRAGEVAALTFASIDWCNGRIAVRGKGSRQEWLPLPQDLGDALLRYMEEGRPPLPVDRVFTKVHAPLGPLSRACVTHIARSALRRAGVKAPVNGAHVFRHSAATAMLRHGASLSAVGAVLRHRSPTTTAHYAKVDLGLLREIAQPWPEVTKC
jgi:integrase/recombinase XerD